MSCLDFCVAASFVETMTSVDAMDNQSTTCMRSNIPPLLGKKGVALTFRDDGQPGSWKENLPKMIALRPSWNYSWGLKRIDAQPNDVEFVPMVWGGNNGEKMQQSLETEVVQLIKDGVIKRILAFNEPDEIAQSNMTVECALARWPTVESLGVSTISPSCAHPNSEWMKSFVAEVDNSSKKVDWIGVHWYGGANFSAFKSWMTNIHQLYNRPILITEFAPADWKAKTLKDNRFSPAAVLAFMKEALPWLELQDWVAGYCWFSFSITTPVGTSSALFDVDGNLTQCGHYYASVRPDKQKGDQSIHCT